MLASFPFLASALWGLLWFQVASEKESGDSWHPTKCLPVTRSGESSGSGVYCRHLNNTSNGIMFLLLQYMFSFFLIKV